MNKNVDVLSLMNPELQLDVRKSVKNPSAGVIDWRDWCGYLASSVEARAAVAELINIATELSDYVAVEHKDTPLIDREDMWNRLGLAIYRVKGKQK